MSQSPAVRLLNRSQWLTIGLGIALLNMTASIVHAESQISLSWRLLGDRPEGGYQAELTIRNDGTESLSDDWEIYFNSSSRLLPESVSSDFRLTHINGDFYSLQPDNRFKPIAPGESEIVAWKGTPWAINVSDTPSGCYMVRHTESGSSQKPVLLPLEIGPFPNSERLRRGPADIEPVVTAESRYRENEPLQLLPPELLPKVIPTPASVKSLDGKAKIRMSSVIYAEPQLENEAFSLSAALEQNLGILIPIQLDTHEGRVPPEGIRLRIAKVEVDGEADEAYRLTVTSNQGIEIVGNNAAGVFYGVQTLRALIPIEDYSRKEVAEEYAIDAVQIVDAPRFRYRGLHLDVARNFQSKHTVMKLLDLMAFYKLNRLHFHLTDDEGWRIEIKQLPELTQVGSRRGHTLTDDEHLTPSHGSGPDPTTESSPGNGFYTQSDMAEILRHAHERHITVIPEIDLPGHARAATKAMEARSRKLDEGGADSGGDNILLRDADDGSEYESVQMWRGNVVDVGRDDTYRLVSLVVDELAAIYKEAGVPLTSIHVGGDEVPAGAWEASPACERIKLNADSKIPRRGLLELYFLNRASDLLVQRLIQPACWEDCLLLETDENANAGNSRRADGRPTPTAYVWNNVWGWGREDAAYRLANAGFDVVLCNATHLYFDLACEKDPLEPGYYWAGFVDARKPFEFVPLDVFQNADRDSMGQPVSGETLAGRTRLTNDGARHVLGIQGQLWSENLRDARSLEYMAFPRLISLAERAWARSQHWTSIKDSTERRNELERDWNQFANRLGQRELPRLDYWIYGGIHYRLPPPGAVVRDGVVHANVAYPGLAVRYTTDGSEPSETSLLYRDPIGQADEIKLKSFDQRGRGSRTTIVGSDSR